MLWIFYKSVIVRETRKMIKQRDRLAASLVRPVLWLWVIGGGMQALAGQDYNARLLPGIVGMTLLFGGMVGGLSIAFDKDAGTMRLLVTSPVNSHHVLLAKALSAGLAALIQVGLLLGALALLEGLHFALSPFDLGLDQIFPWVGKSAMPNMPILFGALLVGAFSCGTLGVLCGVFAKSIDGFAVMMNFVIFPLFFLSGALYPLEPMPVLARSIAMLNPFSYTVDLLRHAFSSHAEFSLLYATFFLVASSLLLIAVGTWRFSRSGAAVPLQH